MNALISLCWLGEPCRPLRNQKWLEHHLPLKEKMGFDKIILLDNASNLNDLIALGGTIYNEQGKIIHEARPDLIIHRFNDHLPRTGLNEYPYCWRGLAKTKEILPTLDKIIFLDTDFYILSGRLATYIKNLDTGWTSFFCNKYGWPEAAINILCKDTFPALANLPIPNYTHYNGQHMEEILPFTKIIKNEFTGDRYGEINMPQTPDMDYYGQYQPSPELRFHEA